MTSCGREGTKGGGGGFAEEGTHGTRLSEESLHCDYVVMYLYRVGVTRSIERMRSCRYSADADRISNMRSKTFSIRLVI